MAQKASFTPGRKWSIGFNVAVILVLVFSVVVMVNFLSREYYARFQLSTKTRVELSTRTLSLLGTLTNEVRVTAYYDKDDSLYTTVHSLLMEYRRANPRIHVDTVDYLRDSGQAQRLKAQYKLTGPSDKNLVIFDSAGKIKLVDGNSLAKYVLEQVPGATKNEFRRKPTEFLGEVAFTSALLDVTSPRAMKAYFLKGHGEHQLDSGDQVAGYIKMAGLMSQNHIEAQPLSLLGTNIVPMDCNLLVIAGPTATIPEFEVEKIEQYLGQGGRLLALFNFYSAGKETGLEQTLARWGVALGAVVKDPENTISGSDVIVSEFSKHPLVNPLLQSRLHLILPRTVGRIPTASQAADAPSVEELAFSGPNSTTPGTDPKPFPLIVAVEKGALKGVVTERGTTRLLVLGDSLFLANRQIDSAANRDFASYALNWLLDRTQLMQGLGPRPITEYQLIMTRTQARAAQYILLGGMPLTVLILGGLVWLRRRR